MAVSDAREQLLTREMIDQIDDLDSLQFLLDDADERAKHIEVDLEFRSDADLDWERRARGALAAHHICIGHLGRRIRALSPRRERPEGSGAAKIEAKALKHAAVAARSVQENEARRLKIERERIAALRLASEYARKTSLLLAFHQAAVEQLDGSTVGRLMGRAGNLMLAAAESELSPVSPPPRGDSIERESSSSADLGGERLVAPTDKLEGL